jgi:multidrug efflux pump
MASISEPFIRRPVGTTLLAIGLFLVGVVAYEFLPVASVPNVDFPMIRVSASRPGADPSVMASTVAAPLERRLGEIAGIDQITSTSTLGATSIQLQFAIGRDIDRAARDVQAAINASLADLPSDLPTLPKFRKANSAAAPVFVLALTSKTLSTSAIYDVADTVIVQRISQVPGVGEVTVSGADQPAVRIALNPVALSNAGIATDDVRLAIVNANPLGPVGIFNGDRLSETLSINKQMRTAAEFRDIVIKSSNGNFVRLSDVADVEDATRNSRSIAWFNKQPAVLIQITKQGDANVIDTVDRVKAMIPELKQWIPAGVEISTLVDRTGTIRASVDDMQWTLLATALLVMVVVYAFLRRITPTVAAGVSVPLALAGTCAGMWLAGFSIDNLSLMALAISVGFVVDDAIVMIENMYRNLEHGQPPFMAALEGAKQIGFTVLSISLSLIAAFTPLIFMDGIVGRLLREFSLTLTFAIVVSTVVSLTITPMICAHYIQASDVCQCDLVRSSGGGFAIANCSVLYANAAHRARFSHSHAAGVFCHDRPDGDAVYQDAQGLFPDRRQRFCDWFDAGVGRRFLSVHAGPSTAPCGYRDGRPCRAGDRFLCRRQHHARRLESRFHVHYAQAAGRAGRTQYATGH